MKKFDHGSKRNFDGGFERRDFGGRGGRDNYADKKEKFQAICSECGSNCEVPFRPSGSKPVFCDTCFRGHDSAPRSFGRDRDFSPAPRRFQERAPQQSFAPQSQNNIEERLSAIHAKLDKITALLSSNSGLNNSVKKEAIKVDDKKEFVAKVEEMSAKKLSVKKNTKTVKKAAPVAKKKSKPATKKTVKK